MIRFCHHIASSRHWTILVEEGRVATRLMHRAEWRFSYAEFKQPPPRPCPVCRNGSSTQPRGVPRRFGSECAGDVQHPSCARSSPRPTHCSPSCEASRPVSILNLPHGAKASNSVAEDRRLSLFRSIRIGALALEKGAIACPGGATAEDGMICGLRISNFR